ncbi:MAG TPA: hypothetical protein VIK91_22465 [Nannocystis sp.]
MRKYLSRTLAAVATAGLMASLSACQVKPGEYRIFKITYLDPVFGPDCGPIDLRDKSTFHHAETVAIFATDPETYYLEFRDDVLLGTRDGSEYSFLGESIEVEGDTTLVTALRTLQVDFTLKGRKVTGNYRHFEATQCAGNCDGVPVGQCTITAEFYGTEIKDVELERDV